jgi:hypothetical protein
MDENSVKFRIELDNAEDAILMLKASSMKSCLWELRHNFWREWKHDDSDLNVDALRDKIFQLLVDFKLDEITGD